MHLAQRILVCVVLSGWVVDVAGKGYLSKCMNHHQSRLLVTCPANHVIYNLRLLAGKSVDGTCNYDIGDCIGQTTLLLKQSKKCQWNRKCNIIWQSGEKFVEDATSQNTSNTCTDQVPNYLSVSIPQCIHSESIIDICSKTDEIKLQEGVVRSPTLEVSSRNHYAKTCAKYIRTTKPTDVWISTDILDDEERTLEIWNEQMNGDRIPVVLKSFVHIVVHGRLEILLKMKNDLHEVATFSLSFSRSAVQDEQGTQVGALNSLPSLESLYRRRPIFRKAKSASLQECMTAKRKKSTLSCDQGEVIYDPSLSAVVSKTGTCRTFTENCEGMTPDIMVQRFRCFWKKTCDLIFRSNWPIASSDSPQCVGHLASFSSVKRHACIREECVYDICDDGSEVITGDKGLIRSHQSYPWNYDPKGIKCRRRFELKENHLLTITADDIDLDPEGSDEIRILHIHHGRRREVFNSSSSNYLKLSLLGGKVDIVFSVSKHTKAGRGFVLLFQIQTDGLSGKNENGQFPSTKKKRQKKKKSKNRKRRTRSDRKRRKKRHRKNKRNGRDRTG